MNRLKILAMIGMITALCSNFAWAGNIDVEVDVDRNAVVNVTLCGDETLDGPEMISDDDTFYILFSATETETVDNICETIEESIPVPPCSEYSKIIAVLHSEVTTLPDDIIKIDWSIDSLDVYLDVDIAGCCDEKRTICEKDLDACVDARKECVDECNTVVCVSECNLTYNCEEQFTCQADYDMCMVEEPEITVECHPETLNLKSNGNYITCCLMSSVEDGIYDIDETTLQLHYLDNFFPALFSEIEEDHLMVKFSRPELQEAITEPEYPVMIELIVSGVQNDQDFEATDSIRVIKPGKEKIQKPQKPKKEKK